MTFILKTYEVIVSGFGPVRYEATSAGKARAKAWRDYSEWRGTSFGDFLTLSVVRRIESPKGFGEKILVGGRPAYRCLPGATQYTRFARDDSDVVLYSHPADVEAVPA